MQVVEGEAVLPFVESRLKTKIHPPCIVRGFVAENGRALCAVVFNDFNQSNIELTIVADPAGVTRGVLRYIAGYVFGQLGCRRITIRTKKRNKHAIRMAHRFGFTFEMVCKRYFPDDDAVVFRMFREDCRWT